MTEVEAHIHTIRERWRGVPLDDTPTGMASRDIAALLGYLADERRERNIAWSRAQQRLDRIRMLEALLRRARAALVDALGYVEDAHQTPVSYATLRLGRELIGDTTRILGGH